MSLHKQRANGEADTRLEPPMSQIALKGEFASYLGRKLTS